MFCRSCGENIPVDSVFCPHCGKNLLEIKVTEDVFREPATFFGKSRRQRRPLSEDWAPEDAEEPEEALGRPSFDWGRLERIGLTRVFWVMGLVFAAVGFIVGVAGDAAQALVWILFGLALLIAAPQAVRQRGNDEPDPEEVNE